MPMLCKTVQPYNNAEKGGPVCGVYILVHAMDPSQTIWRRNNALPFLCDRYGNIEAYQNMHIQRSVLNEPLMAS